jgi:hypothetical protein
MRSVIKYQIGLHFATFLKIGYYTFTYQGKESNLENALLCLGWNTPT